MSNRALVTIAQLEKEGAILAIQDGNHGEKHPKSTDYVDDGIPFIMANNVGGGFVDTKGCSKISERQADRLRIGFAREGDVLLTHKGTIGNTAIVGPVSPYIMLTPQVTYYRTDRNKLINKFLRYAFMDGLFQKTIKSLADQATRPYIGITAQRRLQVWWADLKAQKKIVSILSPYDDLIENNRRRIALLEDAARQLYKEWFVRFRFPGHEHSRIIDGLPEGWTTKPISSLTSFLARGMTPEYDDDGEYLIINQKCIRNRLLTYDLARRQSNAIKEQKVVRYGDVLINSTGTGTLGRVAQCRDNPENCTVDTHVTIARPGPDVDPHWFGYCLMELETIFEGMGEGATNQKELKKDLIGALTVVTPPKPLQSQFGAFAKSTADQIVNLIAQNDKLAQARDLLLPKLMNGEITV